MNPRLQPDVHPDAEILNAFVEQALPQPERAQIVAHLGGCARCRDVVFLAQAAAEADAAPLAAFNTESRPAKSGWSWLQTGFANWRIALIPAAALASAAGLLIWVQTKSASPVPTVAQVTLPPPSAMPSLAAPPVPGPSHAAAASMAPPVVVQQPKALRAESRNSTLSVNETAETEKTLEPRPPVPRLQAPDGLDAGTNPLSMAQQEAVIAPPAPPAPVPPNLVAVHGNLMAPATDGPRPLSAEAAASRQIEVMPQPVNSLATLRLITHPRLPSGLNAVSSAVILDRILAVDPEGALFLSRDATKHWERVPIQWTGKAVSVQAPPRELYPVNAKIRKDPTLHTSPVASVSIMAASPSPAPASPPPADQSPAAPPAGNAPSAPGPPAPASDTLALPGMLFKLTNDHHQTWVSTDGKVWHRQQGTE